MSSGTSLSRDATIAIVGAGAMGSGIAQVAVLAGHRVVLYDSRPMAAARAVDGIGRAIRKLADKGKLSQDDAAIAIERLATASSLEDCRHASLIVEAIVEDLAVKCELFAALESIVDGDAILATNTSSISITSIGAALRLPQRLVGMHFFNPAPIMQLVEVVSGIATSRPVADTVFATAEAWGKIPVHAKSTPGFIVNRVARPYYAEGLRLLTEGAGNVQTLDAIMRDAGGFRMGPFELMDLIGHDVNYAVTQSVFTAFYGDSRFTPSFAQLELVNAGFLGRKSGRGFYEYRDGAPTLVADMEPPALAPTGARAHTESVVCAGFVERLSRVPGVELCPPSANPTGNGFESECVAEVYAPESAVLYLTDGRTATERAQAIGKPNTLVLDLAYDYEASGRVAIAAADQCSSSARAAMVGLLQAAGWRVTVLDDVPALAVMRTVCMLANEAADAVLQGVCEAAAVDIAMQKGVNYPVGPLAWARRIGFASVCRVLKNLQRAYGEDHYRTSAWLRRQALAALPLVNSSNGQEVPGDTR